MYQDIVSTALRSVGQHFGMYGAVCGSAKPRAERNDCRVPGKGIDRRADQKIDVPISG